MTKYSELGIFRIFLNDESINRDARDKINRARYQDQF